MSNIWRCMKRKKTQNFSKRETNKPESSNQFHFEYLLSITKWKRSKITITDCMLIFSLDSSPETVSRLTRNLNTNRLYKTSSIILENSRLLFWKKSYYCAFRSTCVPKVKWPVFLTHTNVVHYSQVFSEQRNDIKKKEWTMATTKNGKKNIHKYAYFSIVERCSTDGTGMIRNMKPNHKFRDPNDIFRLTRTTYEWSVVIC